MQSRLNIYPIMKTPDDMPAIGSRHIHKGGNVWQVTRYANVSVSWEGFYKNKGECVFLKCISDPSLYGQKGSEIHWPLNKFRQDYQPL